MAFRFTEEDFKRYVKQTEHGGRHIWHELQDQLEAVFGVPFSTAPYVARGDRLRTLWFSPKGTPRPSWANQAQFFLVRSIEEKQLSFGLMVECVSPSEVAQYGQDPDQDGPRLVERLESDSEFTCQLDQLVSQIGWGLGVNEWNKDWHSPRNSAELLDVLKRMPEEQGWGVHIQQVMTADEAIAAGEDIVNQIMDAYKVVRPLWEAVIPEADCTFLKTSRVFNSHFAQIWLFQANPGQYNLAAELQKSKVGDQDSWTVNQHRTRIQSGDLVILWQSGDKAGIYAIGELISAPYRRDWELDKQEILERPYQKAKWWVDLQYLLILDQPVPREIVKADPALQDLTILTEIMI